MTSFIAILIEDFNLKILLKFDNQNIYNYIRYNIHQYAVEIAQPKNNIIHIQIWIGIKFQKMKFEIWSNSKIRITQVLSYPFCLLCLYLLVSPYLISHFCSFFDSCSELVMEQRSPQCCQFGCEC